MFIKDKKALEAVSVIIFIVIAIFSLAVLGLVGQKIMNKVDDNKAETVCAESVNLRSQYAIQYKGDVLDAKIQAVPLVCKTIPTYTKKQKADDKEKIKQLFADKVARCWEIFGEGKQQGVLSESQASVVWEFKETKNQCFTCYDILVDQDAMDGGEITAEEITKYLENQPYKKVKDMTYLQFVQYAGGTGTGRIMYLATDENGNSLPIKPGYSYGISFAPKLDKGGKLWEGVGLTAAGLGGGAFFIVCTVATGGVCGLVGIGVGVAGAVAGGYTTAAGINRIMSALYGERDVSSIYIDTTKRAQEKCTKDATGR